jgi:hypothetical protein
MEIRVVEDTLPCTKTAPHPAAFLSEVVQYWTAIYPELTHHQEAQSTTKPILTQERNRFKETIMRDKDKGKSEGEQGAFSPLGRRRSGDEHYRTHAK